MPTAIEFQAQPDKFPIRPFCVLYGDEPLLAREALALIESKVLDGEDAEFSRVTFTAEKRANPPLEWRTISDELSTNSLFGGGQRLVIIENADDFLSGKEEDAVKNEQPAALGETKAKPSRKIPLTNREHLEAYAAKPSNSAILVLIVRTWPSNTKLYKAIAASGLPIECKTPSEDQLPRWLTQRAEQKHLAKLTVEAAEQLLDIVILDKKESANLGILDQELAKLSVIAIGEQKLIEKRNDLANQGKLPTISTQLVIDNVGHGQIKTAWLLSDAMNTGYADQALKHLARLIESDVEPIVILAMISSSLRKYAAATRGADLATLENKRIDLKSLLTEAGMKVWPAALQSAEVHLKQLTRPRGRQLLPWLLDADLALKGQSSSGHRARFVLEQLIVRLGRQTAPRA